MPIAINVAWNKRGLILPLSNLGYRKNSMKVKIAMFDAASVYVRVTLTAARSSLIKCLRSDDMRGPAASTQRPDLTQPDHLARLHS
jgi:hypothetical protein